MIIPISYLDELIEEARGGIDKLYIHHTGGTYTRSFPDYHLGILGDGSIDLTCESLTERKEHTYHRNSRAIGIALDSMYDATPDDFGDFPYTPYQIECLAQVIAKLCSGLGIPIDDEHVMTHAEAADNRDGEYPHEPYGPDNGCERWDLWKLSPDAEDWSGGDTIRGKAIWYQNH